LMLISVVILVIFLFKFALIFPAVAVEAPNNGWLDRLRLSWRQMDGNLWRFIGAISLTLVPIFFFLVVLPVFVIDSLFKGRGISSFALSVIGGILQPVVVMIAAAVASWLYASVSDNKSA